MSAPSYEADLVRRTIALFNTGRLEDALEHLADDVVMDWANSMGPLKGVYRGRDEVLAFWRSFFEAWEEITFEIEELLDLGDGHVLSVHRLRMRGRGSGVDVTAAGVQRWIIRDGLGHRVTLYQSKADALAAARA